MSVSAFHHQFKALTASPPVQYLKSVRLHKARALIVNDGAGCWIGWARRAEPSWKHRRGNGAPASENTVLIR